MMLVKSQPFAAQILNAYQDLFATMDRNKLMIHVTMALNVYQDAALVVNVVISKNVFKSVRRTMIARLNVALLNIVHQAIYVKEESKKMITAIEKKNAKIGSAQITNVCQRSLC